MKVDEEAVRLLVSCAALSFASGWIGYVLGVKQVGSALREFLPEGRSVGGRFWRAEKTGGEYVLRAGKSWARWPNQGGTALAGSDRALSAQNRHVRDLQAVVGHMGKVLRAVRSGQPEPEPLDLAAARQQPLPDLVAEARSAVIQSMDLLVDLRAQLEGVDFESGASGRSGGAR